MSLGACSKALRRESKGCERTPEVSMYLAQLLLRLDQGSDFKGYFWLYRDPEDDDKAFGMSQKNASSLTV